MDKKSELKDKASSLPKKPGVYIMKGDKEQVIYVGKAKSLRNRVSQYFGSENRHTSKTKRLVSNVVSFDIIVTQTEFEALVLENSLIKRHKPKYNILLKDDKGYPYIKINSSEDYADIRLVQRPMEDSARYFGPFSGRQVAKQYISTLETIFKLKTCRRKFPRDIGKERPCLNMHINKCIAPCAGNVSADEYRLLINGAIAVLSGKYEDIVSDMEKRMLEHSDSMNFERAAELRDTIALIEKLGERQKVAPGGFADMDVVGFYIGQTKSCMVVLHYICGRLEDKEYTIFDGLSIDDENDVFESFIKQYYSIRGVTPRSIVLSTKIEDFSEISDFISKICGRSVEVTVPQRGIKMDFVRLALENAKEEVLRVESVGDRLQKSLDILREVAGLEKAPFRIEAYDVSNTAGEENVGVMVVFENGNPLKSGYRKFKIKSVSNDDYGSMKEMLSRRLENYRDGVAGFDILPDMILMDGGQGHAKTAKDIMRKYSAQVTVMGMVKDSRHRTRGLIFEDGREISLETIPILFSLIGRIQEEVHRFAITYHRNRMNKRMITSSLDQISGVGLERRKTLLKHFKTIKNIKSATLEELSEVVPATVAKNIIEYFKDG